MGLLDKFGSLDDTQTQGLLAAASQMLQNSGPSRTPVGFGQIVGSGMEAYQGSTIAAKRRKAEEEQAKQMAAMRALQMQEMQGGLMDRQRARGIEDQIGMAGRNAMRTPGQMAASLPGGPTVANAAQIPSMEGGFDQDGFIDQVMQIDPMKGLALKQQFAKQAPQVDRVEVAMRDGKPVRVMTFKDGTERVSAFDPKADMVEVGLGNRKQFVDKNQLTNGQTFAVGQSPDSAASNKLGWANFGLSQKRLNHDASLPRGQIIQTDQGPMLADPRAGTARPVTGVDGQALGPKAKPVPTQIQKAFVENGASLRKVKAAIDAVEAYPAGLGAFNYLGDTIRQRSDPEGVNVRALVADIGSQKIHDRSGAAVTAAETPRLKPFIPAATDDPKTVIKKLKMFENEYQAMQTEMSEMYSGDMGYRPLGKPGGDEAAPTIRKYNPKTGKIE